MMTVRVLVMILLLALVATARADQVPPALAGELLRIVGMVEDDPQRALDELARLAKRYRSRPQEHYFVLRERVALLFQEDQVDVARQEMLAALADQPPDYAPDLRFMLGQAYLLADEPAEALEHFEIWSRSGETLESSRLFLWAYACVRLERFGEAATILERAIDDAVQPRAQWIEVLAYVYTRLDRPRDAVALLEQLIVKRPGEARWWRQLASVYLLLDEVPRGTAAYTIVHQLSPLALDDARRLARLFAFLGMPEDGAQLFQAALTESDQTPALDDLMLQAELWILAREFEAAVGALERAAEAGGGAEAGVVLAQLYLQRERFAEAKQSLLRALDASGDAGAPHAYYLLAVVQLNLGELAAAEASIDRFADDPEFARRAGNLRRYLRAQAPGP